MQKRIQQIREFLESKGKAGLLEGFNDVISDMSEELDDALRECQNLEDQVEELQDELNNMEATRNYNGIPVIDEELLLEVFHAEAVHIGDFKHRRAYLLIK